MDEKKWLAERFEENRPHLRAVADRLLGPTGDADDAVQEAWLRFSRADVGGVENLGGWLTTVVARVCLDMLRARQSRREELVGERLPEPLADFVEESDPEREVLLADAVGPALLVVLDTLAPAERVAFVLHDIFAVPFDAIAPIVDRSPAAARQLASRARRRVRGAAPDSDADSTRQRKIVDAFLTAAHTGDFAALLALLDPDVIVRADAVAAAMGAEPELSGAVTVANVFAARRARGARPATVNGMAGAVWTSRGRPRVAFCFTIERGKIAAIDLVADPERLRQLEVTIPGR